MLAVQWCVDEWEWLSADVTNHHMQVCEVLANMLILQVATDVMPAEVPRFEGGFREI